MLIPTEREKFKISMIDERTFKAEVVFKSDDVDLLELPKVLKEIKDRISVEFNIPFSQLRYQRLLEKRVFPDGLIALLEIIRTTISSGKPILKFCGATLRTGRTIENMILLADVFPFSEKGAPNTQEAVLELLQQNKIKPDFINHQALKETIELLSREGNPIEDIMLAQGVLPEVGQDARLDFNFQMQFDRQGLKEFLSSRKAKKGDILCQKHPRTMGEKPGRNLFGEEIKSMQGRDFTLKAGQGTILSDDKTKIFAEHDGVVVVRKEETRISDLGYIQTYPCEIQLRIDPLVVMESSRTVEIVTKDSVEVQGHLLPDSNIISEGEVYIHGDVLPNSKIHAADDVYIQGSIYQGSIVSSKGIQTGSKVNKSVLSAKGKIRIKGAVRNTQIYGEEVEVGTMVGSVIIAARKAIVHAVEMDESEVMSEIQVGIKAYKKMKIKENQEFIDYLDGDLGKMKNLFSEEIVEDLTYANTELMFLRFAKKYSHKRKISNEHLTASKQLLESVPSLKVILKEKRDENNRLETEMESEAALPAVVIIKEKIQSPVRIQIDSARTQLAPGDNGQFYRIEDKIIRKPLDPE